MNRETLRRLAWARFAFVIAALTAIGIASTQPPVAMAVGKHSSKFSQRSWKLYEFAPSRIDRDMLYRVGEGLKLRAGQQEMTLVDENDAVRAVLDNGKAPRIYAVPNLANKNLKPPSRDEAIRMADAFVEKYQLAPNDGLQLKTMEISTLARNVSEGTRPGTSDDVLRTVRYVRVLDGVRVFGQNSILALDISADGVEGLTDTLRGFKKSDVEVKMRPEAAINRELATLIRREQPRGWKGKSEILSRETIYFEQGKRYLQPALLAAVRFNGDDGQKTALYYVVPAMENTPEKIVREKPEGAPTTVKPNVRGTGIRPIMLRTPYPYQANPVLIGMYVVKEDHECWVSSANGFWSSLAATNGLFWLPKKKKAQYFWDYVWLWYADGGVSDHSMVYPGQVHLALVEGHGAPWLITCYKNYGEVIHIKKIKGLGANMGYNEKTAYVIWHSCDVVPAPGDPHAGDFTSGSVFTPWWSLFKGMRGTYGYRTTMYICDGVMSSYGARIGLGMPMLSSWLHCTDHSVFGHQNGFEYGSAVIVSGHEQDTLYTNSPLPNPTSLTIWWNHA